MAKMAWRWLMSDSTYFNFVAGYNKKPRDTYSTNESPRYQYTDRFQGGTTRYYDKGYGEDYWSIRENFLISGNVTYFGENLFNSGAHEIKFGVEIRPYQHITRTRKYWEDQYGFFQTGWDSTMPTTASPSPTTTAAMPEEARRVPPRTAMTTK